MTETDLGDQRVAREPRWRFDDEGLHATGGYASERLSESGSSVERIGD
jgi:hypothetical protein